jgi:hypothetical protein
MAFPAKVSRIADESGWWEKRKEIDEVGIIDLLWL